MAQQYPEISEKLQVFIEAQKIFFVATATADSRVNLSPKGMDAMRVLGPNRVIWLNHTGSGNETAAHLQENPRMTIMFNAFEGNPMILRLYGNARAVHKNDSEWAELSAHFGPMPGARQLFDVDVDLVQTSCGMGVPYYEYVGEREMLPSWAVRKGEQGVKDYWIEKNQFSIDGLPTGIIEKNI